MTNRREKWFAFWAWFLGTSKKELTKPNDFHIETENSVKKMIVDILDKRGTKVSMGPKSNVYIIDNGAMKILIDGANEVVRARVGDASHTWGFRGTFIEKLIDITIDWIENDRKDQIAEFFENDIAIVNEFNRQIALIENRKTTADIGGHVVYE